MQDITVVMGESILLNEFRNLVEAGHITAAVLVGQKGGYRIVVQHESNNRVLCSARGPVRVFASLDTAVPYLKGLGLSEFIVNASQFVPGRLRSPRPDRSEAMKRTRTTPIQEALL
jgi:hypothetical protein